MSKKQWGHGYFTGKNSADLLSDKEGFVGLFFHTFAPDGILSKQGVVRKKVSDYHYLVSYFNWFDGAIGEGEIITLPSEDTKFSWYLSAKEMRNAFSTFCENKICGCSEAYPGAARKYDELIRHAM